MAIAEAVAIGILMLVSITATMNVPLRSVHEKRLAEEARQALDDDEKRQLDHESFLGKDQAEIFDQLSIDASKAGVRSIYDKIDKDGDGEVTEDEMTKWMKKVYRRQVQLDSDNYWSIYIGNSDAKILTWETFRKTTYGLDSDLDEIDETNAVQAIVRKSIRHYKRLWLKADKDGDGALSKQESRDFFFPEESDDLMDVIVDETMEQLDGNNDGYVGLEEYLSLSIDHPAWTETERKLFVKDKDLDRDDRLSRHEIKEWLHPPNRFGTEAQRLILQADTNQDGVLSKEEMIKNYDVFVGSKAMNFTKETIGHDEF